MSKQFSDSVVNIIWIVTIVLIVYIGHVTHVWQYVMPYVEGLIIRYIP